MANHISKELKSLLSRAETQGFRVVWRKSGSFQLIPPQKGIALYTGHFAGQGFHPIRRYLEKVGKLI